MGVTNADAFKMLFEGLYATELWSWSEEQFLAWLNSDYVGSAFLERYNTYYQNYLPELRREDGWVRRNHEWISVNDSLPVEAINPVTMDLQKVICFCDFGGCPKVTDVRTYCHGTPIGHKEAHFWHGPKNMDGVVKWAAENKEPIYPTWGEYLHTLHNKPSSRELSQPIPADIAQKLGIEPKDG